jgi:hypothetical protein
MADFPILPIPHAAATAAIAAPIAPAIVPQAIGAACKIVDSNIVIVV